jgi:hypothetical protein
MLENEFYKLVTPEGKQNYIFEGQAKMLLLLCQAVDKLAAAQQERPLDLPKAEQPGKVYPGTWEEVNADNPGR